MLRLPELACSRLAELIEGAYTDHGFQFLAQRRDSMKEIRQRGEGSFLPCGDNAICRALGQSLHARQGNTNCSAVWHERWPRFVRRRRQECQAEPMTFEDIN